MMRASGAAVTAIEATPSISEHYKISEEVITDQMGVDPTVEVPPIKLGAFSATRGRQKKVL
jgi:hypothetical protein